MYVKLTEQELPQAKMVVDKFHVIKDANVKIDEARRIEQEATKKEIKRRIFLKNKEDLRDKEKELLEEYFKKYPSLKEFYWVKEKLREMYRAEDRKQGEEILDMWPPQETWSGQAEEVEHKFKKKLAQDWRILYWNEDAERWKCDLP